MDNCVFCKIMAKQIPANVVYEDEHTIAFMDIGAVNPGHMLVACKPHVENVFGLDDALAAAVMRTTARVARALKQALAPEGGTDRLPLPRARPAAAHRRRDEARVAGAESAARGAAAQRRTAARRALGLAGCPRTRAG